MFSNLKGFSPKLTLLELSKKKKKRPMIEDCFLVVMRV